MQLSVCFWMQEEQHRRLTLTANSAGTGGLELLPHPGKSPFFGRWWGSCWGECSRSHEAQNVSLNLCLWWGKALAFCWCWHQVGWMILPHLNSCEQVPEELRVVKAALPPTQDCAREQAQDKGAAAILKWYPLPLSPSKRLISPPSMVPSADSEISAGVCLGPFTDSQGSGLGPVEEMGLAWF